MLQIRPRSFFEGGDDTSVDSMDIWQLPIGVTFSGDIEAAGWTVAPTVDFSVVPAFGDKKATLKFAQGEETHVNVVDTSVFQTKIGVSAQKDAWGFELFYKLGAGQDDRLNNTFNANVPSLSKYFLIANQEGTEKINGHPISARKEKSNPRENPFQGDYG